jgi:hypothetical protein
MLAIMQCRDKMDIYLIWSILKGFVKQDVFENKSHYNSTIMQSISVNHYAGEPKLYEATTLKHYNQHTWSQDIKREVIGLILNARLSNIIDGNCVDGLRKVFSSLILDIYIPIMRECLACLNNLIGNTLVRNFSRERFKGVLQHRIQVNALFFSRSDCDLKRFYIILKRGQIIINWHRSPFTLWISIYSCRFFGSLKEFFQPLFNHGGFQIL